MLTRFLIFWLLLAAVPLRAESPRPLELLSWAPVTGAEALWRDSLGGLKTATEMFNANGGINGRPLAVEDYAGFEDDPDFESRLAEILARPGLMAAVGGPVHLKAEKLAALMGNTDMVWFGPWSNEPALYRGGASDPLAILPPWDLEFPALLDHIQAVYEAEPERAGPVFLTYYNFPQYQEMAARVREMAAERGLELKRAPVNVDFTDWAYLAEYIEGSGALISWLSQGATAGLVKAAKARMPEALYLTNSVNATNPNLVVLSGGAWNGMIFPAVLKPSRQIPAAYDGLIRKYGPVGLSGNYQSYLGFAQGQILVRALSLTRDQEPGELPGAFYGIRGFETILSAPLDYSPARHLPGDLFYLARAYGNGHWEAVSRPVRPAAVESGE